MKTATQLINELQEITEAVNNMVPEIFSRKNPIVIEYIQSTALEIFLNAWDSH